jgi:hypothetical protein
MSRAQPKSSSTDRYARRIALAIGKGRPPPFDDELDEYCSNSPHEIFAALAGAIRHMPPSGKDETLAIGYLFLLQRMLEHLRYRSDRGYGDAAKLIADFQAEVAAQAEAGQIGTPLLALVGGALQQSNIPASPELTAASVKNLSERALAGPLPADVHVAMAGMLEACDDPFTLVTSLMETGHAMPVQTRGVLAGGLAAVPQGRAAAVLFLLDPQPEVRRAVAQALVEVAGALGPSDLRRLIAMRNWRPESERADVDAVIRTARAAGIDCAQWDRGGVESLFASAIDGAAAQGFLLISPAGQKKRLSTILTKYGIADAWSGEPETRRRIEATLTEAETSAPLLPVSKGYLDRAVAHHLALCTEKGEAPPLGLLQVAETIGAAGWQPARMDLAETVAALMAELPKRMREPAQIACVLRTSHELADLEAVAESWFEDDPQIAQAVGHRTSRAKLVNYLLQSVIARQREKWADIFLRTALWMREAAAGSNLCWRELMIVSKAVADGCDLSEIGLMRDIAGRTIVHARQDSGWSFPRSVA